MKCNVIGIHSNRHISVVLMARGMRGFAVVAYYLRVVKVKLEQRKGWATELALTQSSRKTFLTLLKGLGGAALVS